LLSSDTFKKGTTVSKPKNPDESKDDVRSAPESGEPAEAGRTRGQIVEPGGTRPGEDVTDASNGTGEEFESGRQDAAPRSGK
jgi:hypothetical protein